MQISLCTRRCAVRGKRSNYFISLVKDIGPPVISPSSNRKTPVQSGEWKLRYFPEICPFTPRFRESLAESARVRQHVIVVLMQSAD